MKKNPLDRKFNLLTRNEIIHHCSKFEDHALAQAAKSSHESERQKDYLMLASRANQLNNDCCETRHHLRSLRVRLRELLKEECSLNRSRRA